ncbi:uncharacterized protein LOC143180587 [Calliopsis andreniformis]|uniref:uncharacterized protein LOC143180587 n=1 Tax=Calliopsis andreniformis TaxID=337506 RepID=UPI003FCD3A05
MLGRKVTVVLSVCSLVTVGGMPQNNDNGNKDVSFGLPFLQFTNGGIRFNFGGYHAEAGLGGLLGGSRTEGGLHASAGTPWGAHAAAGLGGLLSGDNANTGGGLFARAGLGNGRPEAAAGLGGVLDGSGRSNAPVAGGLFAGATTGARGVSVTRGTASASSGAGSDAGPQGNGGTSDEEKPRGRTNIQIISRGGRKSEKLVQASGEVTGTVEVPVQKGQPVDKKIREAESPEVVPIASAGIFGTLSVNPVPVTTTVQKVKVIGGSISEIEPAPPVPPLSSEVNEIVQVDSRPARVKIVYPKLVVRKRFWGPRKQIIYNTSVEGEDVADSNTRKLSRRQAEESSRKASATSTVSTNDNGFFDDVFKIPVSTINAVNQLLNNNSG